MGRSHCCSLVVLLLLVALLLVSSSQGVDGRVLMDDHQKDVDHLASGSSASLEDDFSMLIGEDGVVCEEKDEEECLKRRMIAEAHLDYIYTQHQKNP
ncbi:Putative phytosulfokines 6 [Linum perenne]